MGVSRGSSGWAVEIWVTEQVAAMSFYGAFIWRDGACCGNFSRTWESGGLSCSLLLTRLKKNRRGPASQTIQRRRVCGCLFAALAGGTPTLGDRRRSHAQVVLWTGLCILSVQWIYHIFGAGLKCSWPNAVHLTALQRLVWWLLSQQRK